MEAILKFGYLVALYMAFGAACAPEPRPANVGHGGDTAAPIDGAVQGGSGGSRTGGTGGQGTGGAAGAPLSGGAAGMSPGGAAGAGSGSGGMAGAIAMTGGMAGMVMPPPPPGPVAKPTSAVLFAGTSSTLSKVVLGDARGGYFYVVQPGGDAPTLSAVALAGADLAGLPAGVTFAQKTSTSTLADGKLFIFGFNFRANDGDKWRWIDSTDHPGFSFWAKVGAGMIDVTTTTVDGTNVLVTDPPTGTCASAPCVAVPGKAATVTSTWTQFKFKWSDFTQSADAVQGPVDFKQMGRIDVLFALPGNTTADFFMTGVKLATAAELN